VAFYHGNVALAVAPYHGTDFAVRDPGVINPSGLSPIAARLAQGPATIAYLGNSVTAQRNGFRPHLHQWLIERFGHTHRAINAGFGGVGSIGSVATMDDLVLRHGPDLCFVECLTGDVGVGDHAELGPAIEGIVRKLSAAQCAACFLLLPRADLDPSAHHPLVELHRSIAEHHGVPLIDLLDCAQGADWYYRDKVHVTPRGGNHTAGLIGSALENLFAMPPAATTRSPLYAIDYQETTMVAATSAMLRDPGACRAGHFRLSYPYLEYGCDNALCFGSDSAVLIGLLLVAGPHCGETLIGEELHQLRDRWCDYERLHFYLLPQVHGPGPAIEITPVEDSDAVPIPLVKLIALLTRPAAPVPHRT
jgi:hypothetical protein